MMVFRKKRDLRRDLIFLKSHDNQCRKKGRCRFARCSSLCLKAAIPADAC